jgi:hypothetical protein
MFFSGLGCDSFRAAEPGPRGLYHLRLGRVRIIRPDVGLPQKADMQRASWNVR